VVVLREKRRMRTDRETEGHMFRPYFPDLQCSLYVGGGRTP
jgi:hypothetical protein